MAVQTITYSNKSYINENASVAATNKVQATDMNEIKTVVNNNASELTTTNTALGKIGSITNITLTSVSGTLAINGWRPVVSTFTTDSLEAGNYLFLFYGGFNGTNGAGYMTLRTVIDGTADNTKRITLPLATTITFSVQLNITKTFNSAGTHTINLDVYPTVPCTVGSFYVDIVKLS